MKLIPFVDEYQYNTLSPFFSITPYVGSTHCNLLFGAIGGLKLGLLLALAMPAVITLLATFLVDHCVAATLRAEIASDTEVAQAQGMRR